jgi:hypothetical protein
VIRQRRFSLFAVVVAVCRLAPAVDAQTVEAVGSRAQGMGGAFVAVANDSSATWWNPGGLAAGPFVDMAIARAVTTADGRLPAARSALWSFSLGTPPLGVSYYRLRITDIRPSDPTAAGGADREDRRAGVATRSLSATQFGATVVHTLLTGIHAGATVKYVRGTAPSSAIVGTEAILLDIPELLDRGEDLDGGEGHGGIDVDLGILAVAGPIRVGGVVRNARELELGDARLPRQVRIGAAFDGDAAGLPSLMISLDADVRSYETGTGERRVIAAGAEQWMFARRLGLRGGARFNTVGAQDQAVTAGISVAVRSGAYVDAHVVAGGDDGEAGWGVAGRVSF